MRKLFLKTTKEMGLAPLYFRLHCKKPDGQPFDRVISSRVQVDIERWVSYQARGKDFWKAPEYREKLSTLQMADSFLSVCTKQNIFDMDSINAGIRQIVYGKQVEAAKDATKNISLLKVIDNLMARKKEDMIKKVKKCWSPRTYEVWGYFRRDIEKFLKVHPCTVYFTKEDMAAYRRYIALLMPKTQKLRLDFLKQLLRDDGTSKGLNFSITIGPKERKAAISLTVEEINDLYEMNVQGETARIVRGAFLFGTFTGQRLSDFMRVKREDITEKDGDFYWTCTQQKTGTSVTVPLFDSCAIEILKRNNYHFKKVDRSHFDRYLRNLFRELSEIVPSLTEWIKTPLSLKQKTAISNNYIPCKTVGGDTFLPRWALVGSHTARRTFATLMYQSKRFSDKTIMALTGHSSISVFENYLRVDKEDAAGKVMRSAKENPIFKG